MYRTLLSIFICVCAVQSAPPEANSQITHDKRASITDTLNSTTESRIENIPPILHLDNRSEEDSTRQRNTTEEDSSTRTSEDDNRNSSKENLRNEENIKRTPVLYLDSRSEDDSTIQASKNKRDYTRNDEDDENINSSQEWKRNEENKRTIRSDVTTVNYESETTAVTEREDNIDEIVDETDDYESRTKPPAPRFISKLSYFQKNDFSSPVLTNLVERPGRRRFKSKCRCEKIWNCPKLQITVPRCPNEYFMCCF